MGMYEKKNNSATTISQFFSQELQLQRKFIMR